MDLTPKQALKLFEGDGGAYYIWSSSDAPALGEAKVGAGKLVLQPHGFALPHYADSSKLGYVLQGDDGLVGMVFPNTSEEVVIKLKKGDVIPIPLGSVSWWFNNGGSNSEELVVVFLGETTRAYIPGQFTYFFVAGTQSLLGGFSTEFVSKAYNITKDEADKITKSQTGVLIIKLGEDEKTKIPKPSENSTRKLVRNITCKTTTLTEKEFPFLKQAGLSASLTKLEANAISSPIYTTDATVQVVYVAGGRGQIQIVGLNGQLVLDTEVKSGDLLVVPSFFMVAKLAGGNGLECFSVITSSQPVLEDLAGKTSALGALSPEILQIALNITPELQDLLSSRIRKI
ncbi:12S seed storage globulin 2-like [Prunus avium]|uniref:12S seed storage globulin 2-like n=1 Tax=Prunus avium TaxID=42229 RepID=A0A6P5RD03_PRUAV|nr:12S seed storage globulin 2-like [Prunus avium]